MSLFQAGQIIRVRGGGNFIVLRVLQVGQRYGEECYQLQKHAQSIYSVQTGWFRVTLIDSSYERAKEFENENQVSAR